MKKYILLLLILLCVTISYAAEEKQIHVDWHPYHSFFTIDDDYYELTTEHLSREDEILITALIQRNQQAYILRAEAPFDNETDTYYIKKESCTKPGLYRFCLVNISLDPDKEARSDDEGNYRYGTYLRIKEEQPDLAEIEITRNTGDAALTKDQEASVSIILRNKGLKYGENLVYEEEIGEGLEIVSMREFTQQKGNKLIFEQPLVSVDERINLNYRIRVTDYINKTTLKGSISYENPEVTTNTKDTALTIVWPYSWSCSLSQTKIPIEEEVTHSCTFKNKDPESDMALELAFSLPTGVIPVHMEKLTKDITGQYVQELTLEPDEEEKIFFVTRVAYTGTYNFTTHINAIINDAIRKETLKKTLTVETNEIDPNLVISQDKIVEKKDFTYGLYLHNKDEDLPFFDVEGWVGAKGFFNDTFAFERIPAGADVEAIFKTYLAPKVEQPTTYTVKVWGTFSTSNNEKKEFMQEEEVIVMPPNQTIMLTQEIKPSTAKLGDVVTVTVGAENVADVGQNKIILDAAYPRGVEKIFGDIEAETYLYGGEKRELYVYKLQIPYDYPHSSFVVIASLQVDGKQRLILDDNVTITDATSDSIEYPRNYEPQEDGEIVVVETTTEEDVQESSSSTDTSDTVDESSTSSQTTTETTTSETEETPTKPSYPEEDQKGFFAQLGTSIANFFAKIF